MSNITKLDLFAYSNAYEDFEEGTERYYAQWAIDEYGSACRDNSVKELIAIGKRLEQELSHE